MGKEEAARRRIDAVLGGSDAWNFGTYSVQPPGDTRCPPDTAGPAMIATRSRQERIDAAQRLVEGSGGRCPRWGSNPHWDPFKGKLDDGPGLPLTCAFLLLRS